MSIIRDFVTKLPAACGVPAGLAEIYGELNGRLFDYEKDNPDGALHRKHFESVYSRIILGFDPWQRLVDDLPGESSPTGYAVDLLIFAARTIDAKGGDWRGKETEKASLLKKESEPANAKVAALLSVEQASTLGNWA